MKQCLTTLGYVAVALLFLTPRLSAQTEPAVYRFRTADIQAVDARLRERLGTSVTFSIRVENEPGVYRLCVLAPESAQTQIPGALQGFALLLPKAENDGVVPINLPPQTGAIAPGSLQPPQFLPPAPLPTVANVQFGTTAPPQTPVQPLPSTLPPPVAIDETRDSYAPTSVPFHRLEQTLCSLLVHRMKEMQPGRFLLTAGREGNIRRCTLEFDRPNGRLVVYGERSLCDQVIQLVHAIDQPEPPQGRERRFMSIQNVNTNSVRQILEINRKTSPNAPSEQPQRFENRRQNPVAPAFSRHEPLTPPKRLNGGPALLHPSRNPVIQLVGYQFEDGGFDTGGGGLDMGIDPTRPGAMGTGVEVVPDFRYEVLSDLDVVIFDGTTAEITKFIEMIRQIEELSKIAEPKIEVYYLKNVDCISLNWVIAAVFVDLLGTKQGVVKVLPMIRPNAMLLVGWGHAMQAMKDLIETLDQPVAAENTTLRIIRLQHASAQYVQTVLRGTFPPLSAGLGNAFAPRVNLMVDSRTNSLIVQAGPNDMQEIERLVKELDVPGGGPKLQIRQFKLNHTLAADIAQVLTDAITPAVQGTSTSDRKLAELELPLLDEKGQRLIKSGIMADVRISRNDRTNTIIVTAPEICMPLLEEMVKMLDIPSSTAVIKVFEIFHGDANSMVLTLRSLIPAKAEGTTGPQLPGIPVSPDEDSLIPIHFAVDTRTNSILAAGAPKDLMVVEALLISLDREDQQSRKQTVYALKSMEAENVALAVNQYIKDRRTIQQAAPGVVSQYQQIESEIIVVPEAVSNSLIVSATPRYFDEIIKVIEDLDKSPPQVVIQVLIGEVSLQNTDELGAEFGLQDSLLFNRSTFNAISQGTRKITRTENGVTTVIEEPVITNGSAVPGWLFNESPNESLGDGYNSNSAQSIGTVGSQLLTNFATGRVGAESGFGGLVFSANSDAVSIMIRALQETNRLEILSRPIITAMNNQFAGIHVGEKVPRFGGSSRSSWDSQSTVEDYPAGLVLKVSPSISPEGKIVMAIAAEKSKVGSLADAVPVGYSEGREVRSPKISIIKVGTTVSAMDGETVVLGGLITKEDQDIKRKVPFLADIPLVGKLFQYQFSRTKRTELLIILTPHIVRNDKDMEEIKRVEAARMSWCLGSVAKLHGDIGVYNVVGEKPYFGNAVVEFPEAADTDGLQPIENGPPRQEPTLAPPEYRIPVPTLAK